MIEIDGTGVLMHRRENADVDVSLVPSVKPYIFDRLMTQEIAIAVEHDLNVLLTGPTGCGKTSVIAAIAALCNVPLIRFNLDGETRVSSLRGQQRPAPVEGVLSLAFYPGALVSAMKAGHWVLLDEIDAALPAVVMMLQPVLEEGRAMFVPELNETIHAHPDFRVFATGNTVGWRASHRTHHAGTNAMNDAFLDRFGAVMDVGYPDKDTEVKRVRANCPEADDLLIEGVCRAAAELRQDKAFKSDFSTRRCIQWVHMTTALAKSPTSTPAEKAEAVLRAADITCVRKMTSAVDVKVSREVIRRIFGYKPLAATP